MWRPSGWIERKKKFCYHRGFKFFLLTRKGNKFLQSGVKANQDRAVVVSPFHRHGNWLLGLSDGHGFLGHCVAERNWRVQRILPTATQEISLISFQTFVDLHNKSIVPVAMVNQVGGTAISMLKIGKTLCISNLGDSLSDLCCEI